MKSGLSAADDLLLQEGLRGERIISLIRAAIWSLVLIEGLVVSFMPVLNVPRSQIHYYWMIWGFSIFGALDVFLLGHRQINRLSFQLLRYGVITLDFASIGLLVYYSMLPYIDKDYAAGSTPLFFLAAASVLLAAGALRYSWRAAVYSGVCAITSYIVIFYQLWPDRRYFFFNNDYNWANAALLWALIVLTGLVTYLSAAFRSLILKTRRQDELQRFLPDMVVKQVLRGERHVQMAGERKRVTILFSDIRGFSSMAENSRPEEVIEFLNSYFSDMVEVVFGCRGSLDKIVGDGLMAVFGAPISTGADADDAVRCALNMLERLEEFNRRRQAQSLPPVRIGIGVHSGEVVIGNVGAERRMDFTAIGDTVNLASRLEALTKEYNTPLLVSGETKRSLRGDFSLVSLGDVTVRGRSAPTEIFSLQAA
ncbi:MAG: adenylate/guanylate cyclase domain-containing protein [Leptospirales bacterium]|nr:adenylate/guanylate cyclase domain-containing protein [Leptospirales bacterium]